MIVIIKTSAYAVIRKMQLFDGICLYWRDVYIMDDVSMACLDHNIMDDVSIMSTLLC
jgi:hypothetical protein